MSQVEFLFRKGKDVSSAKLDDEYATMMNEKAAADLNLIKMAL
jgi:hypothetical protein